MAVPVLTTDFSLISNCNQTTGWTAGSLGTDTDTYKEGGTSLSGTIRGVNLSASYNIGSTDLSNTHLRIWFVCTWAGVMQTYALGGVQYFCTDSTANTAYWNMLGSDTYDGGWKLLVLDTSRSPTSGTCNMADVTDLGLQFAQTSSPKNVDNTWWDYFVYGNGYTITGGDSTDDITWDTIAIEDAESTNGYGVVQKINDVFFVNGALTFGDTTSDCYFKDTGETVIFTDEPVASDLYKIAIRGGTGTTQIQMGDVSGSGDNSLGYNGISVSAAGTQSFTLDLADAGINTVKFYGCNFDGADYIYLGDGTTELGGSSSTIEFVDCNFSNSTQMTRDFDDTATQLQLRNQVVGFDDTNASVVIADNNNVDGNRLAILNQDGFTSLDNSVTETIQVLDHDFSNLNTWVYVYNNKTWDLVNPTGSVDATTQDQIEFADSTSNEVNVKYYVNWTVAEPDGDPIGDTRVFIVETAPSVAIANSDTADSTTGQVTSTYLAARYADDDGTALDATSHTPNSYKIYKYDYISFATAATINSEENVSITLLPDLYQDETSETTARNDGTLKVTINEATTNEHSLIKYTDGTGTLSIGNTVTASGGATGVVVDIIEGDSTAGTAVLDTRNATSFTNGDTLSSTSWSGASYTNNSEQRFHWIIEAGTISGSARTAQEVYDHINAKLTENPIDTTDNWDDVITAGRAEFATPVQGVSVGTLNTFKTVRNAALSQGWIITNLDNLGQIEFFTDNAGNLFYPEATVNLQVTVKDEAGVNVQGARVWIAEDNGDGTYTAITDGVTNSSGIFLDTYPYTSDVSVLVRVRLKGYIPFATTTDITDAGMTVGVRFIADTIVG